LSEAIRLSFSEKVNGVIWKTLADPVHKRLYLEVRDLSRKQVSFSAVDLETATWLWKDVSFDERWWISLQAVFNNMLLLTIYTDTHNPDQKSVLAFDVTTQKTAWWKNNFTVTSVSAGQVWGVDTKFGAREVVLSLTDGQMLPQEALLLQEEQNLMITRPFQYQEGTTHFDSVRTFLNIKCEISPIITIEYCEYHSLILISAFTGKNDLANYLFVFNSSGELMIKETLGEHLNGIALDTFFIFSGYLIFVKNKCELVSYKLV
jgi:hypothetical protein